ncbi:hypothetical protein [Methylobacterium sp. WL64]|uniref:hypothetical protein n=1 Tax=Methylobacterium sp. WL64 TaxID=2603894 RepID=UPI001FEFC40B|nr:hypothetical protein [Methylobacterium sp. WL64]
MLGRVSCAAVPAMGLSSAALARDAASATQGAKGRTGALHGIGFNAPRFGSDLRTSKDQPYTWPVSDRYHPVSKPFYGRAY